MFSEVTPDDIRYKVVGQKVLLYFKRQFILCSKWGKWFKFFESGRVTIQRIVIEDSSPSSGLSYFSELSYLSYLSELWRLAFSCSKLTIETLEQGVNYIQS